MPPLILTAPMQGWVAPLDEVEERYAAVTVDARTRATALVERARKKRKWNLRFAVKPSTSVLEFAADTAGNKLFTHFRTVCPSDLI